MDYSDLPHNEEITDAVEKYCDTIVECVKAMDPDIEFDVDKEYIANDKETEKACIIDIQSQYGFISIFPNFKKKEATAFILNRGMIMAMDLEGFDDDAINNTDMYTDGIPFSPENAEMLALVLTEDLDLQHQKILYE